MSLFPKNTENLRVIKTARDVKAMNQAASEGIFPMLKWIVPSPKISSKIAVYQNKYTAQVQVVGDFREDEFLVEHGYVRVIDWQSYYKYQYPEPFAAYLIPEDLAPGEIVWIEDLIEDFVGVYWNQGDTFRLSSAKARWNGSDFEILYDEDTDYREIIG
jgi:hypothetical protein